MTNYLSDFFWSGFSKADSYAEGSILCKISFKAESDSCNILNKLYKIVTCASDYQQVLRLQEQAC